MSIDRRSFIRRAGLGAGGALLAGGLLPSIARAQSETPRKFVFVYFSGGWDTLLCLDPRDPNVFTEGATQQTRIQLAWDRLPAGFQQTIVQPRGSNIAFGPAIGQFARHHDVSCVVRGLSMDTVTHEVGRRYMLTGQTPSGLQATGSSIATRVVAQQGDRTPVPNLVSRVETYNKGDPNFASGLAVNGAGDLLLTLRAAPDAPSEAVSRHVDVYRSAAVACDPAGLDRGGFFGLLRDVDEKARELLASELWSHFDFAAPGPEMEALRARYGIQNAGRLGGGRTPAEQAALAFQALHNDVAQTVTIEMVGGLDTHDESWADDHPVFMQAGFDALAILVDDLKASGLVENTTVVVFSEFGRTAKLNNRDGRDHSLSSSCLLLGAGVPHGKVVGATSDTGMNPLPIDPTTGEVSDGGATLTPNNVLASVMQSAGYDTDSLRTDGLPCLIA